MVRTRAEPNKLVLCVRKGCQRMTLVSQSVLGVHTLVTSAVGLSTS